jgi:hypothetical protein
LAPRNLVSSTNVRNPRDSWYLRQISARDRRRRQRRVRDDAALHPAPQVRDWVSAQPASELCTTAVTAAQICRGFEGLPGGRRKDSLLAAAIEMFAAFSE